jgi:hypothetical protein
MAPTAQGYASIEASEAARMSEGAEQTKRPSVDERHILALRVGHGANCSSIGSVVDTLFASAVVGAMVFAAVAAAMKSEPIKIAGSPRGESTPPRPDDARGPTGSR